MKVLVIGATGATGKDLIQELILEPKITEIVAFVRRSGNVEHPKLKNIVVDFDQPESWSTLVSGDAAFSCMGTTLKDAGSKEVQRKIDYDYQYNFAKYARENNVKQFILVSATGANAKSAIFYTRLKGELEDAVKLLDFESTTIFQPGMLERENSNRLGEKLALKIVKSINTLGLLKKQKPLPTKLLAKAMVKSSFENSIGVKYLRLNEIHDYIN